MTESDNPHIQESDASMYHPLDKQLTGLDLPGNTRSILIGAGVKTIDQVVALRGGIQKVSRIGEKNAAIIASSVVAYVSSLSPDEQQAVEIRRQEHSEFWQLPLTSVAKVFLILRGYTIVRSLSSLTLEQIQTLNREFQARSRQPFHLGRALRSFQERQNSQ